MYRDLYIKYLGQRFRCKSRSSHGINNNQLQNIINCRYCKRNWIRCCQTLTVRRMRYFPLFGRIFGNTVLVFGKTKVGQSHITYYDFYSMSFRHINIIMLTYGLLLYFPAHTKRISKTNLNKFTEKKKPWWRNDIILLVSKEAWYVAWKWYFSVWNCVFSSRSIYEMLCVGGCCITFI